MKYLYKYLSVFVLVSTFLLSCDDSSNDTQTKDSPEKTGTHTNDTENTPDKSPASAPDTSTKSTTVCYGIKSVSCDGTCINPINDKQFCGASKDCSSYERCSPDEECVLGTCKKAYKASQSECAGSLIMCDGICIDPQKNMRYCGAKSECTDTMSCKKYQSCSEGKCCIVFKDEAFKQYALANYDTDHDSRVCWDEADKITEISASDELFKQIVNPGDLNSFPKLKKLGKRVFAECPNITNNAKKFTLSYVEEVGDYAFYKTGMSSITLSELKTVDTSESSEGSTFAECPNLETITMAKLTSTAVNMFKDSKKLKSVTMNAAETLSRGTFAGCEALTSFTGKGVTTVHTNVFNGSGIKSVTLVKATKIGFDEKGEEGTSFIDMPALEKLKLNTSANMEVSNTFITKELAAKTELIIHSNKKPGGKGTPHATEAKEWPEGSGLTWQKITYYNY